MTTLAEALRQFIKQKPAVTRTTDEGGIDYRLQVGDRSFTIHPSARGGEKRSS